MPDYRTASYDEIMAWIERAPWDGDTQDLAFNYGRMQAIVEFLVNIRDDLKSQLEQANEKRNY